LKVLNYVSCCEKNDGLFTVYAKSRGVSKGDHAEICKNIYKFAKLMNNLLV